MSGAFVQRAMTWEPTQGTLRLVATYRFSDPTVAAMEELLARIQRIIQRRFQHYRLRATDGLGWSLVFADPVADDQACVSFVAEQYVIPRLVGPPAVTAL